MANFTCCVSGPHNLSKDAADRVTAPLKKEILDAVAEGCTRFLVGFHGKFGLLAAGIVAELRGQGLPLTLELVLPYAGQKKKTAQAQKLLDTCDGTQTICSQYSPNCFLLCSRYLVSESDRVIAVVGGQRNTTFTIRAAVSQDKPVRTIAL